MQIQNIVQNVIYTEIANCQDCYRCVRVCPVKAISVIGDQAHIEDDLCIKCGTCVKECPQHAKTIRSSVDFVKNLITSDREVAVSVAPSFAAIYSGDLTSKLPTALKNLGFDYISETAEGAKLVTEASFNDKKTGSICTACPAVVNYIETYKPEFLDLLMSTTSPMVAHGRLLKKRYGKDCAVVFIGPCAAKKEEALRPENSDAIDAVLTFTELADWFDEEGIQVKECEPTGFESYGVLDQARLFPLQGGMLKTGNISCDGTNANIMHISGADNILGLLDIPMRDWVYQIVEPLFCADGCINGPGFPMDKNIFIRKQEIISYAEKTSASQNILKEDQQNPIDPQICYQTQFVSKDPSNILEEVSEETIQQIFDKTGKSNPDLQLNCGACGYKSCKDNAIAIARGLAGPEMCMPYMRRLAHQRTDKIIETTPNGVVILDENLKIINMNPAFKKMFMCNNNILGKRISYLLDSDNFEKLAVGKTEITECIKTKYGIKYHEAAYALRDESQYVGIYSDVTDLKFDDSQIDLIKNQTLEHARELLDHQISFSQEMAYYLGKSTAQGEELLKRIMDLYEENSDSKRRII
ncbi:MAG: [Fe-Fe] hydrogenase large subunit C-terminal domain-containing protein [Anaerovoracaceae bacterium]